MQNLQGIIQTLGFFEESDHSNEKPIARRVRRVLGKKVPFETLNLNLTVRNIILIFALMRNLYYFVTFPETHNY